MTARLRALHLAPSMPARSGNGLAMRQGIFLEALARNFETDLLVLPVAGEAGAAASLPDELGVRTVVVPVAGRRDTRFTLIARLTDPGARLAAFRAYGRSSMAAHLSAPVLADLKELAGGRSHDLVHVGRSYLADALGAVHAAHTTVDLDEDEWTSYRELAALLRPGDPPAADWQEAEAEAMAALIARSAGRTVRHFIASAADAASIRARHPGLVPEIVPNAVAIPESALRRDDEATLLFLGSFGYLPNIDAVRWFVGDIWPLVQARRPDARFIVAGRGSERLGALAECSGVTILGPVADVADAYARATLCVAPLRAGAGTRLKLLEAAAHRVPIVSTSVGVRGLPLVSGRDLLVADTPAGFAAAVDAALADAPASRRRAESALSIVRKGFERCRAIERLACRLEEIAAR